MGRLLTRNNFLQRAHEVHGDKYDYTKYETGVIG